MPNRYQLAFLATFVSVFSSLVFFFNFAKVKLKEAGYDVSELILIGLPKKETPVTDAPSPLTSFISSDKANMFAQLLALVFAAATSAVIYWKFGSSKSWHPRGHTHVQCLTP